MAAISLTRLVDWCGTPCVHSAEAELPCTDGRPSEFEMGSVVVIRVLAAEWRSDLLNHVTIDAELSGSHPILTECRTIGRESSAAAASCSVVLEFDGATGCGFVAELAGRIVVGDLIAIPCRGVAVLHRLRGAHLRQLRTLGVAPRKRG